MNEDRLKHIDKTKKYWYVYAESHYTLDNYTNTNIQNEKEKKADIDKTDLEHIDKTDLEHTDKTDLEHTDKTDLEHIDKTDLEHIDKTEKYWYAYAESHYSKIM